MITLMHLIVILITFIQHDDLDLQLSVETEDPDVGKSPSTV